ncbi:MAG: hypothetical protein Q4G46_12735 [Propionibacteriaceae bacterium]|nr:hypothetical protein [Propionibacteriaceae bacterium]
MAQSVEQFTEAYTKLLVASWSDESFAQRLRATPEAVAREVGLEIPEGTTVAVVEPTEPGNQDLAE